LVSDFIDEPMAKWNVPKLDEHFLPADVEVIRNIPLSHRRKKDFWAWHFEKTGVFSVRSCYRILASTKRVREDWLDERPSSSGIDSKAWSKLWKLPVPSKVRIFLWRLAQLSLPTGDVRHRRNMAQNAACPICGQEDNWHHSLIDCNLARCVWALTKVGVTEHVALASEPNARQ
jgi:hypothetical protein